VRLRFYPDPYFYADRHPHDNGDSHDHTAIEPTANGGLHQQPERELVECRSRWVTVV
jgi:hypothetical protein